MAREKTNSEKLTESFVRSESEKMSPGDIGKVILKQSVIAGIISKSAALKAFAENIKVFLALLQDYKSGSYKAIPWWAVSSIVFALVYILNPMDAMPDFIPFIGQIDDAAVVVICLKMLDSELKKYLRWKNKKTRT